jgi:tetratricopeptide (TPR) repeat protein
LFQPGLFVRRFHPFSISDRGAECLDFLATVTENEASSQCLTATEEYSGWTFVMQGGVYTSNIFPLKSLLSITLLLHVGGSSPVFAESSETVTLAAAHIEAGDLKTAEQELQKAVAQGTRNPEVYRPLGFICDQSGRAHEATAHFLESLQLAPGSSRAHNNLGAHYFKQGRLDLSAEQFKQTLHSDPSDLTANHHLGLIHLQRAEADKGVRFFEESVLGRHWNATAGLPYSVAVISAQLHWK